MNEEIIMSLARTTNIVYAASKKTRCLTAHGLNGLNAREIVD